MATYYLLKFIKKNPLNRFLIGFVSVFLIGTIASLVFLYPIRIIYYGLTSVEQDDDLSVAFCRSPRMRITAVNNIRTFYLTEDNTPVFQRTLPNDIDYSANEGKCIPLRIKPDQRPNDLGSYRFCQEFDFFTEFEQKKHVFFCSTEFEVVAPVRDPIPEETLDIVK